jgi:hypothetical protein
MRRAITAPMPPPMARPPMISSHVRPEKSLTCASVVSTAIAMPIMPYWLPRRELSGLDSPRSAMMKSTPAAR